MTSLDRLITDAVRRIIRTEGEPGKLGRADGTIRFTDASGTTHRRRKWVRVQRGAEMIELVAYDTVGVPEHADLPVKVAHRDGSPMIIGTGGLAADEFSGDRALVPQHSHDRFSYNPHYATGPSVLPLMAIPSSPPAMTVEVQQGWYRYNGDWKHWDTADSSDLSSYTPAPGFHHFIALCLDRANNALAIVDGSDKPAPTAGVPFTATDVATVTIPDAYRPLCAIRLYNGQTEVLPPDIFMDLRLWGGESGLDNTDTDAIHDNVAGEIAAITEKENLVASDIIVVEDSEAANAKKHASLTNISRVPEISIGLAVSTFMALPGLRGFWPMSALDRSGKAQDASGHGHHLTYNGNPTYNVDGLAPYIDLDGTGDYLSRADEADLDITGTESYIASGIRGLTLGGWFFFERLSISEGLIGKYNTSGDNRSYLLVKNNDATLSMVVSDDGANAETAKTTATPEADTWYFVAGRYDPSSEIKIWLNDNIVANTTSVPASLFDSTAELNVGTFNSGAALLDGRASLCFLCAAALSDDIITNLYEQTRGLFGV